MKRKNLPKKVSMASIAPMTANQHAYSRAGVNIFQGDRFVEVIKKLAPKTFAKNSKNKKHTISSSVGGFASLYKISNDLMIAATTDGVGTKLKLAFDSKKHDSVGIDLVAMCANDLLCVGAEPLFFLDYFATGKLSIHQSKAVITGIVEGCKQARLALVGGETAEMPGFYNRGEYDLAGFAVGVVHKKDLLDGSTVKPGNVLIGIESSGPHSNGFSLIRKLLKPISRKSEKAFFNACFTPTMIYTDAILALKKVLGKNLKGMAHITGSGFLNIPRIQEKFDYEIFYPKNKLKNQWVFKELQKRGNLSNLEMFTTFNMGIGLVLAVSPKSAQTTIETLKKLKINAHELGYIKKRKTKSSSVSIHLPEEKLTLNY